MNQIWLAFLTGLTTGGISCLAVQGGLLASSLTQKEEQAVVDTTLTRKGHVKRWSQVGMFLLAKLIAYTLLGALLGYLGATLTLSPKMLGLVQIIVGLFMLATAARLLNIHPIFRYFVIQPPRFIYKLLKGRARSASYFAPATLGFLTVLMPCGVTQAMMAVALATGSPILGATIMAAFVLGTSPVFFALGVTALEFLERKAFSVAAAGVIAVLGIVSINGGMALRGSIYTFQNFYKAATTDFNSASSTGSAASITEGKQDVTIQVASNGYTPNASTLKAGVPVRLTLKTSNTSGCSRAFTIPDLNIRKVLPATGVEVVEFTPTKTGRLAYACAMGMYTGEFTVVQ